MVIACIAPLTLSKHFGAYFSFSNSKTHKNAHRTHTGVITLLHIYYALLLSLIFKVLCIKTFFFNLSDRFLPVTLHG